MLCYTYYPNIPEELGYNATFADFLFIC